MKKIIPCLDIRDGKVVKGVKFDGIREVGDPVERAKLYNAQGADELVLYDISASVEKRIIDLELVAAVKAVIDVPLSVAGGIGNIDDFEKALKAGADKVSLNSLAIRNPEIIRQAADKFGSERVIIGIDAMKVGESYKVMLGMGKVDANLDLIDWVKQVTELGAGEICLNSIDADGTKHGYDIDMLNAVCAATNVGVIASGGCGELAHFADVFAKTPASAALAASVFHMDMLTVGQIKTFLEGAGS